jgi:hypothetical protein
MTIQQEVLAAKARVIACMMIDPNDKHSAFGNELAVRHLIESISQQAVYDHLQHVVSVQKFVVPDGPVKFIRRPGLLFPEIKGKRHHTVPGLLFEVIEKGHKVIEMIRDQVKRDQEGDSLFDECFNLEEVLDAFDEIYFNQENP